MSVARNSRDVTNLELSSIPYMFQSHMKQQNYYLKKYTNKTLLDVNTYNNDEKGDSGIISI